MQNVAEVKFKKFSADVQLPQYKTEEAAGFDIIAHSFQKLYDASNQHGPIEFTNEQPVSINLLPHSRVLVGCGFAVALPKGYELQVRSRSGLALKEGIIVLNAPGTIDSDYRGEVGAIICNTSMFAVRIKLGERIAQCVLKRHEVASFEEVDELPTSDRGTGGYGSTGK